MLAESTNLTSGRTQPVAVGPGHVRCSWKMNFESHIRLKRERTRIRKCLISSSVMPSSGLSLTLMVSHIVGVEASSSKLTSN